MKETIIEDSQSEKVNHNHIRAQSMYASTGQKPHVIVVDSNEGKLSPHSSFQDQPSPGLENLYKEEGC